VWIRRLRELLKILDSSMGFLVSILWGFLLDSSMGFLVSILWGFLLDSSMGFLVSILWGFFPFPAPCGIHGCGSVLSIYN
jgi:hypothetical protein